MSNSSAKPKVLFWIISIIALIWNIMGVLAYLGQAYITEDAKALLSESDQAYYNNVPAWITAAFAIAVFSGTLGCIGLLIRKKWATTLLILSFITVIIQSVYSFFIQNYVEVTGDKAIMQFVIIVIAIFLVWFSKDAAKKEILS